MDTTNCVLAKDEVADDVLDVPVRTLDAVLDGRSPTLTKMDVEGFETDVVAGSARGLDDPGLLAVILELNGSGTRYGFDEDALHRNLLGRGFETFRYRSFGR